MSHLRRHDWRSHRAVDCTICGVNLENRHAITKHRADIHNKYYVAQCKFDVEKKCMDGLECLFTHMTIESKDQPSDGDSQNRSKTRNSCKEGKNCQEQNCEYTHINKQNIQCRFQNKCSRKGCEYNHNMNKNSFFWESQEKRKVT